MLDRLCRLASEMHRFLPRGNIGCMGQDTCWRRHRIFASSRHAGATDDLYAEMQSAEVASGQRLLGAT